MAGPVIVLPTPSKVLRAALTELFKANLKAQQVEPVALVGLVGFNNC